MKIRITYPGQGPQVVDAPAHLIAQWQKDPNKESPFVERLDPIPPKD